MPKNLNELSQMINNLSGTVSKETLIDQLPFVEDSASEMKKVKKENDENQKRQQEIFKSGYNTPFNKDDDVVEKDSSSNSKISK